MNCFPGGLFPANRNVVPSGRVPHMVDVAKVQLSRLLSTVYTGKAPLSSNQEVGPPISSPALFARATL